MFELVVEKTIACAHYLREYPGACARLHGHNYTVRVLLRGTTLNAAGLLVDFSEVKRAVMPLLERFDHQTLNDISPFDTLNPSTENFAKVLADELVRHDFGLARVHAVQVQETPTQWAVYYVPQPVGAVSSFLSETDFD